MTKTQSQKNADDIKDIKTDIKVIKENHLAHIEKDIATVDKKVDKMDLRLWYILAILVASTVVAHIGGFINGS